MQRTKGLVKKVGFNGDSPCQNKTKTQFSKNSINDNPVYFCLSVP